jgi:hypothetical protein
MPGELVFEEISGEGEEIFQPERLETDLGAEPPQLP